MMMKLLGKGIAESFKRKHAQSRKPLDTWIKLIEMSDFGNFVELRKTFPSADQVGTKTVFNIGGNKYRCIVIITYSLKQIVITHVLTHEEYDAGGWQ